MYRRIGVLAQDEPGTMVRIASMVLRRGYDLISFSAERGRDDGLCWCRLEVAEGQERCDRMILQLRRLMETVEVVLFEGASDFERERRSA
ncbi:MULTISPECIES: ACT domain-containing protein [Dethiosulfovibrio]|uniref:Acetolactate synthase n=2 Tax=Dethiosulfovibrio TaxID=47054 RepID=A0ABS9ENI2_9BACT|nr:MULTISPECIES: ACT domain-containing protein [Dethiosulfovibrio]MCF4114060.1 hypothetical protein [Dethiosulfovibrio russensis]MCF4142750.1 hypothetical protein [Dethiosulfovibrio marinus]MCF4144686.1 hypothetical protein [Dethiosulfovibrio acidaminovorans]